MKTRIVMIARLMTLAAVLCSASLVKGQPSTFKCRKQAFSLNSGVHDGRKNFPNPLTSVFRSTVQIANAPWVKIHFGNCELGQNSSIKMTSLEDGGYQHLNAVSMKQWQNTSAYFNGDAVEVELYVDPEDKGIFFEVVEVVIGERSSSLGKNHDSNLVASDPCTGCGICGSTDDRVPSSDPAIGRISGIETATGDSATVGTGWIASNGTYITAGHVIEDITNFTHSIWLEFNVPASDPNGDPNFAHPNHQYVIDSTSANWENVTCSRDWAAYRCFPNPNTGLFPVEAQNAFYRLSLDSTPSVIRLTGFGIDYCPVGSEPPPIGNGRNSSNNTQQTDIGPNNNFPGYGDLGSGNFVYWSYCVDHRSGNSGGPVIPEGTGMSVGIVTCCPGTATSFDADALETAVNNFPGANIIYADNGHPYATGAGTVFRPYSTIAGATAAVPAGGIVSIVRGSYNESLTINTAMTIVAPVGDVTIGPVPPPKIAGRDIDPSENDRQQKASGEFDLSQNYPNPFNPETAIPYTVPKRSLVELKIYDLLGHEVRTLVYGFQAAGPQLVIWDGKNNHGQPVSSGVYIYRLVADGFMQTSKALLLR